MKLISVAIAAIAGLAYVSAAPASNSICDRYAFALNLTSAAGEYALMGLIVERAIVGNVTANGHTVEGLINNALTKPFFNGANPTYRSSAMAGAYGQDGVTTLPDFTTNTQALTGLVTNLKTFFGSALGCTEGNFVDDYSYGGLANQTAVHANMPITQNVFNAFNAQVANSALSYGVTDADVATVGGVLASFLRGASGSSASICNDPTTCSCAAGLNGGAGSECTGTPSGPGGSTGRNAATTLSVSIASVVMAALAAIFAVKQ